MPPSALSKTDAQPDAHLGQFAADARAGLTTAPQKELHSRYFYDDLGTALFDAITHLPEYGLTRADARLLRAHAGEIVQRTDGRICAIELGCGSGIKTRPILEAARRAQGEIRYRPIDVSAAALARCEREVADVAEVRPILDSYLEGMAEAARERAPSEKLLTLFLGSNIGNFERTAAAGFLNGVREQLRPGDALLVGADLVKLLDRMLLAYDDPAGVTAAFNLNLLGRLNRELGANFDLRAFEHQARWNEMECRIEMHLRSRARQTASIPGAGCAAEFEADETIWTESSHKFYAPDLPRMAERAGFRVEEQWIDREWAFVESLWIAV